MRMPDVHVTIVVYKKRREHLQTKSKAERRYALRK